MLLHLAAGNFTTLLTTAFPVRRFHSIMQHSLLGHCMQRLGAPPVGSSKLMAQPVQEGVDCPRTRAACGRQRDVSMQARRNNSSSAQAKSVPVGKCVAQLRQHRNSQAGATLAVQPHRHCVVQQLSLVLVT